MKWEKMWMEAVVVQLEVLYVLVFTDGTEEHGKKPQ
jgi:hypothetical protein